jgi:ABC-type sugar transport system permease subunit
VTVAGAGIGRVAPVRGRALPWVLPSTVALLLLIVVPVAFLVYVSLTGYELGFPWSERRFVGLQQYQELRRSQGCSTRSARTFAATVGCSEAG